MPGRFIVFTTDRGRGVSMWTRYWLRAHRRWLPSRGIRLRSAVGRRHWTARTPVSLAGARFRPPIRVVRAVPPEHKRLPLCTPPARTTSVASTPSTQTPWSETIAPPRQALPIAASRRPTNRTPPTETLACGHSLQALRNTPNCQHKCRGGGRQDQQDRGDCEGGCREAVWMLGDGANDADLLVRAGTGIAMRGPVPAAIDATDGMTIHGHDDGVAHLLDTVLSSVRS
ncbi:MAG: HAD hydrolase family protein [Pseudonocardiaceae bacterium]